ncbi:metallophosphoesterase [Vampirovibrio chlorellavorus]|uniref:metallophosphoesterase n=1 Tax=Vampirovibrio chlorellavorus TaxID=758823 RepID=UPI0026F132AF|nr:metallophosphoesterase [Vampirovibrio chlorellavorus]
MDVLTHNQLRVSQRQICLPRLPQAFHGLRVVQLSDLHFYEYTSPDFYNAVVRQVNALNPDLILLTGDVVHYGPDYIEPARSFLHQLRANFGKWAILGNHDYNDSQWGQLIEAMLPQAGFRLLKNESDCLQRDGQRLWLAGLDDLWYGAPNISQALAAIPTEREVTLMMAHNPLLFDPIALGAHGQVDLVLAGHTHAGHVYIPFLGPIYRKIFRMKYRYGLYEKNGCQLHVTSGVGSAAFYLKKRKIGFPRFRFNTWPEIAVLTLSKS